MPLHQLLVSTVLPVTMKSFAAISRISVLFWLFLVWAQGVKAQPDAAINQSVWMMLYGVTSSQANDPSWWTRDDDGDGLTNAQELVAGTNPFSPSSTIAVSTVTLSGGTVSLTFPTVAGKLYILEWRASLTDQAGWMAVNPNQQIMGDGSAKVLSTAKPASSAFFRVLVEDVDSDADGVSDWAEMVTGFDPGSTHTHGAALDDHSALAADLTTENVVTVVALKPSATEPPNGATLATDTGTITITRGGTLHFSTITVPLSWSGTAQAGIDYSMMPASVTFPPHVGVVTLTVIPMANPVRRAGVAATAVAQPGGGYQLGSASSASVLISPAAVPAGSGLTGYYYTSTSTLINGGYNATTLFDPNNLKITRTDPQIDFVWTGSTPGTGINATYYTVRWMGQVQPEYSETYFFDTSTDDGVKLWVNGQLIIDGWSKQTADRLGSIALQGGALYDIKMEYYQATGNALAHLYWYSNSQTRQIIPSTRLYPTSVTAAPPAITSPALAYGFVGQPFSFTVTAASSGGAATSIALGAGSRPLPPGLSINGTTGLISGTPTAAGDYQVSLVATNSAGTGSAVLDLQILQPDGGVTRELWPSLAGPNLSDIPLATVPTTIDTSLHTLEDTASYGTNTGERLRGYFTVPVTGNYFFWLAASNNAELWISNDSEPVNIVRRSSVSAPGTAPEAWNAAGQTNQQSSWLALDAGSRYYYEVRHNVGSSGASSNLSVAWLLDPAGTATSPGANAVVPSYVLSRYDYPAATTTAGALYVTTLSPQGAATSSGAGSADLRVNPGLTQAILHFNYGNLTSPRTAYHIHAAQDSTGSGPIVFDLDDVDRFHPELKTADGGYIWNIVDAGALTAAQIVTALQQGYTYFNVHTVNFPAGEIRGNLRLVDGSQNPPAPVADPGYTDDSTTDAGAARFLNQAAFGASPTDMTTVKTSGYSAWINQQFGLSATHLLPDVQAHVSLNPVNSLTSSIVDNAWWRAAVTAPDQLRQRVAFALSEILVVSASNATLSNQSGGLGSYYDTLSDNAFGNFRTLLEAATLHPTMGYFLNMQGNAKGDLTTGLHPNENYGREIMQLFSIGLNRLWPDGTLILDSRGNLVPTYDQSTIGGMARVFTGWTWSQALQSNGRLPTSFSPPSDYIDPMVLVPTKHELGSKILLNNVVLPPATGYNPPAAIPTGSQADPSTPAFDSYCLADLEKAIDNIFAHPNVGPYICRQLIQRLVESNPSPAYVYRVTQKFEDDGSAQHARGNMQAVIKAILLDGEARNPAMQSATGGGKQREPLLRIAAAARTFPFTSESGTYAQSGGLAMTLSTTAPHRLSTGDRVSLNFEGNATGTPPVAPWYNPTSVGSYTVQSTPTTTSFTVNATGLLNPTYTQAAGTNSVVIATSGPVVGGEIYLKFLSGGAPDGIYTVATVLDSSHITVNTVETPPATARSGSVLIPQTTGAYVINNKTGSSVITVTTYVNHNLQVNDRLWIFIPAGSSSQVSSQEFAVSSVIDENHFVVNNTTTYKNETNNSVTIYPLAVPPVTRSGQFVMASSKFDMGNTNGTLAETPLDSPTVFNFFYPDFQYPGNLAAANITTPEFQLTTDTNVINLTNTVNSMILTSSNTNGLSNFSNGAIMLDLGTYMRAPYSVADSAGVSSLVDKLGDVLACGQLTAATKSAIVGFVTGTTSGSANFPSTSSTNIRDRVRAIVQMILASPEYAIQH